MTPRLPPDGRSGLFFVYGEHDCDPRERPCKTALHQAFRRIFERGEPLRSGGMILPAADVEFFGTEYYRKNFIQP